MRYGLFPIIFISMAMVLIGLLLFVSLSHSQTIILSPTSGPTYVYPGTATAPAIVIPPSGAPTYVYPGNSPSVPLVGVPAIVAPVVKR